METIDKTTDVLNDLLRINNDRIEGYNRAIDDAEDLDLKALFKKMVDESRIYANRLTDLIRNYGGDPDVQSTTSSGKLYRLWMDVKSTVTGKDRQSILSSCEFGEDAAQKVYRDALVSEDISQEARELIAEQQAGLLKSHDMIKEYRYTEKEFDKTW